MGSRGRLRNGCNSKWYVSAHFMIIMLISLSSNCSWLTKADDDHDHHDHTTTHHLSQSHTVQLSSLLPPTPSAHQHNCTLSPRGHREGISLEVRHRHGPCSPLGWDKSSHPTHAEILEHDEARVKSMRDRVNPKSKVQVDRSMRNYQKDVDLPAKSGSTIGSANFIVTVGLGTPKKDLSLIFDTGSDFTWTQCEPCVKACYEQQEPKFDPRTSSTYSNISCSSPLCAQVRSATSASPICSASNCVYGIQYGDSSISIGFFAKDTLYLGSQSQQDIVPGFLFGCGEDNEGLFQGCAGLIGLGRDKLSLVSQTAYKYGNYFSYCLPYRPTSTGHLTFGRPTSYRKAATMVQYTPMLSKPAEPSLYFIELEGISVGGQKLSISPSVFSAGGTLIDSGTVITRLPPEAYSALRAAFSKQMSKYPKAPSLSILDTCYDFSSYTTITIPKISLFFGGGTQLDLGVTGILFGKQLRQVCLGFAGNSNPTDVAILGNTQQLTFDVVYDVAASRIGFAPGGCL